MQPAPRSATSHPEHGSIGFLTEAMARARADLRTRPPKLQPVPGSADRTPLDFGAALRTSGISVIAEVKRSSPSAGAIADPSTDAGRTADAYARGGAAALSVLTESRHFGGDLDDLRAVRAIASLPILRKDFIVDATQMAESRANGADAVLLIVAALSDAELTALLAAARDEGLAALVETHSDLDLERALAAGAGIIGVNSRNLETLQVDLDRALGVLGGIPGGTIRVLESGIRSRDDVRRAEEAGADAVLVGEALMRAADPAGKLQELLGR